MIVLASKLRLLRGAPAYAIPSLPVREFNLQFAVGDVRGIAGRYAYEDDGEVLAIGCTARRRGYDLYDELVAVCRWKTKRSGPLVADNDPAEVEAVTQIALREGTSERERMSALRSLRGVDWPTASVLLHLAYPERWPILDKRALHALGVRAPSGYSFRFWSKYVAAYERLLAEAGVAGRTLDRALWQWSAEQGEPLY